jgi:hypothetical protein
MDTKRCKMLNPCLYGTLEYAKGHNCWNSQRITDKERSRKHTKGLSIGSRIYALNYFGFYSPGVSPIFALFVKSVSFPLSDGCIEFYRLWIFIHKRHIVIHYEGVSLRNWGQYWTFCFSMKGEECFDAFVRVTYLWNITKFCYGNLYVKHYKVFQKQAVKIWKFRYKVQGFLHA